MRILLSLLLLMTLPLTALAQTHSSAPLIAVGNGNVVAPSAPTSTTTTTPAPAADPNFAAGFPESAVTKLGAPDSASSPAPASLAAPPHPDAPPAPVSKLWPRDTVPIFMQSCVHFHPELIPACNCIITNVMKQMQHDEFLRLSQAGTIEDEQRIISIRERCVATPKQRQ